MQTHKGSCHCGEVKYEIQADIKVAMECNCSICSMKGTMLSFVTPDQFKLLSGENSLTNYKFHRKVNHHTFCKHCGVTPFLSVQDPKGRELKAINVRTLEGLELKTLEIKQVDGRSF